MEELNELINSNLNTILFNNRKNRVWLAGQMGISKGALTQRLTGNIKLSTIAEICEILDIKASELFLEKKLKIS